MSWLVFLVLIFFGSTYIFKAEKTEDGKIRAASLSPRGDLFRKPFCHIHLFHSLSALLQGYNTLPLHGWYGKYPIGPHPKAFGPVPVNHKYRYPIFPQHKLHYKAPTGPYTKAIG